MKRNQFYIFLLIFTFLQCKQQPSEISWIDGDFEMTGDNDKLIMIDFYGTTCGPCIKLTKETFPDPEVIKFTSKNLQCYKVDAWKKENKHLSEEYTIFGVPTIVFLTPEGEEIERLIGFMPPDEFLRELKRIKRGEGTFLNFKSLAEKYPDSLEIVYNYALKSQRMNKRGDESVQSIWRDVMNISDRKSYEYQDALLNYKAGKMWKTGKDTVLAHVLDSISYPKLEYHAREWIISFYHSTGDTVKQATYYKDFANMVLNNPKKYPNIELAGFLNSYAWRMSQIQQNLDDALVKIRLSIKLSQTDTSVLPRFMDTEAEILWRMGYTSEAIRVIDNCIEMDPEDKYYKNQRIKFQKNKI